MLKDSGSSINDVTPWGEGGKWLKDDLTQVLAKRDDMGDTRDVWRRNWMTTYHWVYFGLATIEHFWRISKTIFWRWECFDRGVKKTRLAPRKERFGSSPVEEVHLEDDWVFVVWSRVCTQDVRRVVRYDVFYPSWIFLPLQCRQKRR